VRAA
jgi:hypothetical protein